MKFRAVIWISLFAAPFGLAACTTDSAISPLSSAPPANSNTAPQVVSSELVAVRIGQFKGIPQNKGDELKRLMELQASQNGFEVVKDSRRPLKYILTAQMDALVQNDTTQVNHSWTVTNPQGAVVHSFTLNETQSEADTFAWTAVTNETLNTMAQSTWSSLSSWHDSTK